MTDKTSVSASGALKIELINRWHEAYMFVSERIFLKNFDRETYEAYGRYKAFTEVLDILGIDDKQGFHFTDEQLLLLVNNRVIDKE